MVIAVQLLEALKGGGESFDRVAREIKIKGVLQRRVAFMRGKDLDISPGETDQVGRERGGRFAQDLGSPALGIAARDPGCAGGCRAGGDG